MYRQRKKVKVNLYIDEELWKEFRKLVWMKHERFWGVLGYEVEQALRLYIVAHTNSHTLSSESMKLIRTFSPYLSLSIQKVNPPPRVLSVYYSVRDFIRKKYNVPLIQQATRRDIQEAISYVRGSDPRTIRKWFTTFLKYKLIKHVGGEIYELI